MGIFKNIFETKAGQKEVVYTTIAQTKATAPVYSKVDYKVISEEGYKRNFIMFRCIQEVIKAAIQLDWKVMKYKSDGKPEEIPNHPAIKVIEKPNKLYGEAELIKRAIAFYYIGGEAPFHRLLAGNQAKELYVYRPDRVKFNSTGDMEAPYQNITYNSGIERPIEAENFMLWKAFDPVDDWDGLGHGMSMAEPILKNGDLLNELINWNVSLLQNGGNLSGVIAVEQTLPDNVYKRSKAELKNEHSGSDNVGKWLFLEGGAKFFPTTNTPKDMDWIKGKESVMLDICIGMGIDPIIIGFNEHSSYNNKNEAMKSLYTNSVIPLMRELADQLGPFIGVQDGEYLDIEYSHIPCLQEDMKELSDRLANAKDMTVNEKRKARGLEEVEGGDIIAPDGSFAIIDGKVYLPTSLIPVGEEDQQNNSNNQDEEKSFMY